MLFQGIFRFDEISQFNKISFGLRDKNHRSGCSRKHTSRHTASLGKEVGYNVIFIVKRGVGLLEGMHKPQLQTEQIRRRLRFHSFTSP
jgi:hypothetical protein